MDEKKLKQVKLKYSIVGNDEMLNRAIEIALKIAPADLSVLITGENGAGKEVFPRIIHDNSLRKTKKYFAVNCGAIPEGTIDSELFGHIKGAFTGAVETRKGYFSVADGGTLFLDEVGELPLPTQARLLRVLETGEYIPVGASEVMRTNVRIVAATNVDLPQAVSEGRFREDLFYRLNTVEIAVPPLRKRGSDVVLLFKKFALDVSEKYHMPAVRLTEDAQALLTAYEWPGNVRQLKNLTESLSVTADERTIDAKTLQLYLPTKSPHRQLIAPNRQNTGSSRYDQEREIIFKILLSLQHDVNEIKKHLGLDEAASPPDKRHTLPAHVVDTTDVSAQPDIVEAEEVQEAQELTSAGESLHEMEERLIRETLRRHKGNRKATAEDLHISERTLYRRIKDLEDE